MRVVIDASDTMASLGEVAVWSFDPDAWGECVQRPTEEHAVQDFAVRVGWHPWQMDVGERISGPRAVFGDDLLPATDQQIARTIEILDAQRARLVALIDGVSDARLDTEDPEAIQPSWMGWRTPRAILRHIADTESRAYPRWCGLPELEPVEDVIEELDRSGAHVREILTTMPRRFSAEHRGETWTPVKLLRRLAWHERVELVYLSRRLTPACGQLGS